MGPARAPTSRMVCRIVRRLRHGPVGNWSTPMPAGGVEKESGAMAGGRVANSSSSGRGSAETAAFAPGTLGIELRPEWTESCAEAWPCSKNPSIDCKVSMRRFNCSSCSGQLRHSSSAPIVWPGCRASSQRASNSSTLGDGREILSMANSGQRDERNFCQGECRMQGIRRVFPVKNCHRSFFRFFCPLSPGPFAWSIRGGLRNDGF